MLYICVADIIDTSAQYVGFLTALGHSYQTSYRRVSTNASPDVLNGVSSYL